MLTLGLEFSTQSVKMVLLNGETGMIEYTGSIDYDTAFPRYGTRGGVLPSQDQDKRHTSPLMLMEALDLAFPKMTDGGIIMSRIAAIKTDCMQHCTVYAGRDFSAAVACADPGKDLASQLNGHLTRNTSPIWEDRSTMDQVRYLTESLAPLGGLERLTGNRAEPRFPAAQILRWGGEDPEAFDRTEHIFLLSAFMTSLLSGRPAPVDTGDGWGANMNSCDIDAPRWNDSVLDVMDRFNDSVRMS